MSRRLLILGAGGDLFGRLLLPALAGLEASGRLPDDLEFVAVTRHDQSDDAFRSEASAELDQHGSDVDADVREALIGRFTHGRADATEPDDVRALVSGAPPTIVYLALPPALFEPAIKALAGCELPDGSRIAVEKPFGDGLEAARRLNRLLERFDDEMVYRVDHFLSLPAVRALPGLRFANRLLEPAWSGEHIERIEVTWDEKLGLESRAGYYEGAGALRDMLQNHLLATLCVAIMERPVSLGGAGPRSARLAVLRSLRPPAGRAMATDTRRARYGAGDGRPAYEDEEGVDPARQTETLAKVTLTSDAPRWRGVTFVLRSAKAIRADRFEVIIRFRSVAAEDRAADGEPELLRLDLGTAELDLRLAGEPGGRSSVGGAVPTADLGAYESMLAALLEGDQGPFVGPQEAEEAWRIMQPILDAWADDRVPLEEYPAGSDGLT